MRSLSHHIYIYPYVERGFDVANGFDNSRKSFSTACLATLQDTVTSLETLCRPHGKRYLVENCHFIGNNQMAVTVGL